MTLFIQWFGALDSSTKATWIGAIGTVVAALGTLTAAIAAAIAAKAAASQTVYTKRSAEEAAKAAKAAADQVELQRPHPIVIPEFQYSFAENRGNTAPPNFRDFQLRNIGDSPAFDIEISILEISTSRLHTQPLPYLLTGDPVACKHLLSPARGMSGPMGSASMFVEDAKAYFNELNKSEITRRPDYRHEVPFTISYRSLDDRRFTQPGALVVHFPTFSAWAEPVGSLLGATTRSSVT